MARRQRAKVCPQGLCVKTMLGAAVALPLGTHFLTLGRSQRNIEPRLRAVNRLSAAGLIWIHTVNVRHVDLNGREGQWGRSP